MPTKLEIETAHAAGDTESFDRWTAEAMGLDGTSTHRFTKRPGGFVVCTGCNMHDSKIDPDFDYAYCTRFTTDPTSVVEFEKACMQKGYGWKMYFNASASNIVSVSPAGDLYEGTLFTGESESLNRCAAVHWARADAEERNDSL